MSNIKAAAVQISPVLYSREGTIERIVAKILELGKEGVNLAVFPETVVPYYPYFSFVQRPFEMVAQGLKLRKEAVVVPSDATHAIGDACREVDMVVSIGVNERDGGTLYNTQLLFDADGTLIQRRRKISPTHHERMIWGQGDGSGLKAVDSAVGRIGQLACWEHYNPLARYALMADGEQIHAAMYPGSFGGITSPSRSKSMFVSTLWNPHASSCARQRGLIQISRPALSTIRVARSGRFRAAALPQLSRRKPNFWGSHCDRAKAK